MHEPRSWELALGGVSDESIFPCSWESALGAVTHEGMLDRCAGQITFCVDAFHMLSEHGPCSRELARGKVSDEGAMLATKASGTAAPRFFFYFNDCQ